MVMAIMCRKFAECYEISRVEFLACVYVNGHDVVHLRLFVGPTSFAKRMVIDPGVSSGGPLWRSCRLGLFLLVPVEKERRERKHGNPFRLGVNY